MTCHLLSFLVILHSVLVFAMKLDAEPGFDQNYVITWGESHISIINQGHNVQLFMDPSSGAGFGSKFNYSSGLFSMKIKVPGRNSAGVVTAFYLSSGRSKQDELDFEFLGNREGKPVTLQTNVFTHGQGGREQRFQLWFNPTQDFHDYAILWNDNHVVFYVDNTPIRAFENLASKGVNYTSQPMRVMVSLWNGEEWATDGGRTKVNWSYAPFTATFENFKIDGCASDGSSGHSCSSPGFWWNVGRYQRLEPAEKSAMEDVRRRYMNYDYCTNKEKFSVPPPECSQ